MNAELTVADFRAKVAGHLARAQRKMPHVIPVDVFDPPITPMMDELERLDEFLFSFGQDERVQEMRERQFQQKAAASRKDATLEDRLMRLDRRAQSVTRYLGGEHVISKILMPSGMALLIDAFVMLAEAFPPEAFADPLPGTLLHEPDETVQAIMAALRARKAGAA